MARVSVFFAIVFYSAGSVVCSPCTAPAFETGSYRLEKIASTLGDIQFRIELKRANKGEKEIVEFSASCVDGSRLISVSDSSIVVSVDHFKDGAVRQYVAKFCGDNIGLIKIERENCRPDHECIRPRIILADPSDRILAQIANYENTPSHITIRDNESQIIGRGERLDSSKWKVDSKLIDPVLNALLVAAVVLEENSCQDIEAYKTKLKIASVTTFVAILVPLVYWALLKR